MTKYRKKPIIVDAELWDGSLEFFVKINVFTKDISAQAQAPITRGIGNALHIHTLEGIMTATIGDYIIKGVKGEIYPCKPDIFEQTYEKVED